MAASKAEKEKAEMKSNANQELKNSMFENVFGYKSSKPRQRDPEEEVKGDRAK